MRGLPTTAPVYLERTMLHDVRESMSGVDLAWLRMERPTNPMMVVGVLTLATRVGFDTVRQLIAERLLRFERFRQIPIDDGAGAHWQADPNFDLDAHVHALVLPARAGQAQLEAATSELASTALDPRHPLWQFHIVERYRKGSAIIARIHHCYADGMALLRVMASLLDSSASTNRPMTLPPTASPRSPESPGLPGLHDGFIGSLPLVGSALGMVQQLSGGAMNLVSASLNALAHPSEAVALAKQVASATSELARIATLSEDPPSPLKLRLSTRKQIAWAAPLSLDEVKTIGHALDCTVNDVLIASVAGAFGSYLRKHHTVIEDLVVRALVPVNLRPLDAEPTLGNQFGLVFAQLPLGERNPVARLAAVHTDMQSLKESAQPLVTLWLLAGMGLLPDALEAQAIDIFSKKATFVISNVPGPQQPLCLAGARIEEQLFWVPQAGSIGVGVSLFTYNGRVHFGVMADRNVIEEPHEVTRAFVDEFEKLLLCVVSMPRPANLRLTTR